MGLASHLRSLLSMGPTGHESPDGVKHHAVYDGSNSDTVFAPVDAPGNSELKR